MVPVGTMSGGQKQSVAIARAVSWANKVLFLDEPTAALGVVQTHNVLETIKKVRDSGLAVVLISHSMPHVLEVADRVQVLRLGRRFTVPGAAVSCDEGGASGFIAGRAIWKETVAMGHDERVAFLSETGRRRMDEYVSIIEGRARPYQEAVA